MSHTNTWNNTTPIDDNFAGLGAEEIRKAKLDLYERLSLDHNMDGILDSTLATADGYHKQLTMKVITSIGSPPSGAGRLFMTSSGIYFKNSVGEYKLT